MVSCVVGAIAEVSESFTPTRVLDIGSGTDATSLALALTKFGRKPAIYALEPSDSMQDLGRFLTAGWATRTHRVTGNLQDLVNGSLELPVQSFDLIILSACLPYDAQQWSEAYWSAIGDAIGALSKPPAVIIGIEPRRKASQLDALVGGLKRTGYYKRIRRRCCDELADCVRFPLALPNTTGFLARNYSKIAGSSNLNDGGKYLLGSPLFETKSWYSRRKEVIYHLFEDAS